MKAEQISVFLENKSGRLYEVTAALAEAEVNIRALAIADTSDFGVLRLIVDDNQKAEDALKNAGFTVGKTEVVAIEVEDKPGGLNNILQLLHNSSVNIEYMYAYVQQSANNAVMIFRFDDVDGAIRLLSEKKMPIIRSETLSGL